MTLDDIQESVFQGTEGIERALTTIKVFLDKNEISNEDKLFNLKLRYYHIKTLAKSIPTIAANKIRMSEKIRYHIRNEIPVSGKVKDAKLAADNAQESALDTINNKILSTTEPAVRRNREFEKNDLMRFFKSNKTGIVSLYNLYNMLLDFKEAVNK
jgi:hypothetical protein